MARQPKLETPHNLPVKKQLKVIPDSKMSTMYRIVFEEGGIVPSEIGGLYSKKTIADQALKEFIAYREDNKSYLDFVRDKEYAEAREQTGV